MKPTVHAIGSTATSLHITRPPSFDRVPIGVGQARKVIRMEGVARGPILQFLSGLAEILQDLTVEKFDLARCVPCTHKPGNAVDDQTKTFLTLLDRSLVGLALNRNRREMRNLLDDFFILLSWAARLAPIDREGAQYKAIRGQYRRRPARFKAVRQRGRTPSIRVPSRVQSHVRHDHLCLAACCLSARSSFAIHRCAWKPFAIAGWKAWRNCLLDFRATGIEQKDAAATSAGGLFYNPA